MFAAAGVPPAAWASQLNFANAGILPVCAAFAVVGAVVARSQPRNSVGWLILAFGLSVPLGLDAGMYAVLRYRLGHTSLPLGPLAVFLAPYYLPLVVLLPLPIALFPDGRMPSRSWKVTLRAYFVLIAALSITLTALQVDGLVFRRIQVDDAGTLTDLDHGTGAWGMLLHASNAAIIPYFVISLAWVGRQIVAFRGADGLGRRQLKLLMSGGVICVLGFLAAIASGGKNGIWGLIGDAGVLAIAALPVSMGVAILRYRLYEIDRLISRTISYAIVTGVLVGVFIGIVALTTDVLPFSSPVGVAASTLAAAALFNPLRKRVQHLVDRRFNRARYDAEAIVAAFTLRLRDAVDLDTVRGELLLAVDRAVEPAHASVWLRPRERSV